MAQTPPAQPGGTDGAPADASQRVTITSGRQSDTEQRRNSTAAKMVFGREELDRQGDSTVADILKRLPGVTISGRPGRGGDIRMRGLGNGYTQILLNGERPPRGFSLDTLSPDQIERIEVFRAPTAEFSTQAIAGTINIVLREEFRQKQTQIRVSDSIEQGNHQPSASITHPGQIGALSYQLSATVFEHRHRSEDATDNLGINGSGATVLAQHIDDDSTRRSKGIQLAPNATYRFGNGDTVGLQAFLMQIESRTDGDSVLTQTVGTPPYATAKWNSSSSFSVGRLTASWQHRFQPGMRLDAKLTTGANHNDSDTLRLQRDAGGTLVNTLVDTSNTSDRNVGSNGKLSISAGDGHLIATGWDIDWSRREQTRVSLDNGQPQFFDSGESLSARTRRLAAFVQDEWEITPQWSAYMGLRWEGIQTSSSTAAGPIDNSSSVWSPILQAVWRVPGKEKDQVRFGVTHSYRAPGLSDLVALPVISSLNSPTSPDRIGNPSLRPELSTGLDLAYEHYLGNGGILSANVFARSIRDLIRRRIALEDGINGPRWVSRPLNIGHAITSGLELEAKFALRELLQDAPNIDFRTNYSRFWSRVDEVPGPDNRLDQQPKQTANVGLDYRLARLPLTLGGSLNWTPAYEVQVNETQRISTGNKRQLDLYGLWRFNPLAQVRISANNLINSNYFSGNAVSTSSYSQSSNTTARTYTSLTIRLELKI
ncbi:TonB-dependent receptor [Noviherbaspirillum sp. 17J57-3]|uniref:TonB-dependent receptor n=2 Tax=Noviherbaspirillum galbum TaxID=2709383 RepID=A0A6B3SQK5_9BURK|nr:TonB-dependent receptor [Noviherbaspirillum galbum]